VLGSRRVDVSPKGERVGTSESVGRRQNKSPAGFISAGLLHFAERTGGFIDDSRHWVKSKEPNERFLMLTSQKIMDAINEQIGYEFSASMQYYAIAAHFAEEALPQLSAHFFQQAEEEKEHALRFIKYVVDAGGSVVIPAIDAPQSKFKNPETAVKLSLDQEVKVTHQINALVELARSENDYITINFLQWFLTEQLEEVSSMDNLLKIVQRAGTNLLQADEYLARVGVRTMPAPKNE
jgi:ferritin